ncbi:MAG: FAD-dependent monooxygenase [Methyloceanibacter sp.]
MTDTRFRVAVVGAGPAGATAANALRLGGVGDVALIDRARFPRGDKTCGDGITGAAAEIMREIGLDHLLAKHPKVEKVVTTAPSGVQAMADIRNEPTLSQTYVIPRMVFDAYLANAALQHGAADFTGYKLQRAEWCDGSWTLYLSDSAEAGRARSISADFLIGADGASALARCFYCPDSKSGLCEMSKTVRRAPRPGGTGPLKRLWSSRST